jgi:hypothetical protein
MRSALADIICDVVIRKYSREMDMQVTADLNRKQLELCVHGRRCSLGTHGLGLSEIAGMNVAVACSQRRSNVGRGVVGVLCLKDYVPICVRPCV